MGNQKLKLLLSTTIPSAFLLLLFTAFYYYYNHHRGKKRTTNQESSPESGISTPSSLPTEAESEDFLRFQGGENLTARDILDAPGEVVGKSGYSTLYRARVGRSASGNGGLGSVVLLRFVRPACVNRTADILLAVKMLGSVRHSNLVPLRAVYVGPRGEKLLVHPYYHAGDLSQFLYDGDAESHSWEVIYKLSLGIARSLDNLHTAYQKPIIHGNLKSNNILLDADYQPRVSDFGLHLLLTPAAAQEMLEAAATQGYKAPELIKMKEATAETDMYSLGVIFLEMITCRKPPRIDFLHSKDLHLPTSLRNLILEHKLSTDLLQYSGKQTYATEEVLLRYFELAMACCSQSPALRPNIKHIVKKLEEIEQ